MSGTTLQEIRDAILDGYEDEELRFTIRALMNVKLNTVLPPGAFENRVFNLIEWAERQGRDVELVQATAKARPKNGSLQAIYKKYGMAIPVYVEKAGTSAAGAPSDAADSGLEQLVRPHLSLANFGIWRERMTEVEGRVCLITLNGAALGTGFLVGPEAVLTNYHVMETLIKGTKQAADFQCVFDFKKLPNNTTTQISVAVRQVVDASPYTQGEAAGQPDETQPTLDELDYALIQLAEPVGNKPWARSPGDDAPARGWVRVPKELEFKSPMGVLIAQHPAGQPLKLGIDTDAISKEANHWLNTNGTRVRYATNTLNGSSGSPVFDLDWNLIALHHYGDPAWQNPLYNQGVPIHLIRARLANSSKDKALGSDKL
jgi:hypothetical protein